MALTGCEETTHLTAAIEGKKERQTAVNVILLMIKKLRLP